eukprot:1035353_1
MSAEPISKKRKIVFWHPSSSSKKRKLTNQRSRWFKNVKPTQKRASTKEEIIIPSTSPIKPKPTIEPPTTLKPKPMPKPEPRTVSKLTSTPKPKPNSNSTSSTSKQIKFATPSKTKHTDYNLKSLENDSDEDTKQHSKERIDDDLNMSIKTRSNIISNTTEWSKLGAMNEHLLNHVTDFMKLSHPTMIQSTTIPQLLAHKDVLMKSETGSGKTLAYLIPIVSDLMSELCCRKDGCKVMIIAPTRELSLQIYNVCGILCRHTPFIIIGHLMGGEDKKKEKQRLRKGLTIVIGTPGRILDHLENTRAFKFDLIQWFVLDEADILLRLGFERFIKSIVHVINEKRSVMERCNVLVSATLDDGIQQLAHFILNKHVFVSAQNDDTYVPHTLKHDYICLRREYQSVALIGLLRMLYFKNQNKWKGFKVIVFMSTCSVIHYYFSLFKQCKLFPKSTERVLPSKHAQNSTEIKWFELRGNMTQKDRTKTFFEFCDVQNGVLFCTDVASRGLDIPKVNAIIQFDPPTNLQDYVHRSGRTARIGKAGQTILFLTRREMGYLDILKKNNFVFHQISVNNLWKQLDIDYQKYKLLISTAGQPKRKDATIATSSRNFIRDHLTKYVMDDDELKSKAKEAMRTFVKAYTTYPKQLKSIFYVQNLDFHQCSNCFLIERETRFLRKGGMRNEIKRSRDAMQRSNMRDVAQKITKKRNVPVRISEFASL